MRLEITIPCYNEEHRLETGYTKLVAWLQAHHEYDVSLVIADNGSIDATPEIAKKLIEKTPIPTRYLRLEKPGLALALRAAFDSSNADLIGYCDTDMATDISHIADVFSIFNDTDATVVNGSRWLKNSVVKNRPPLRTLLSWTLHTGIRLLAGIHASDISCGFKFFRRDWYASMAPMLFANKFFLGAELIWYAEHQQKNVTEIPVRWTDKPGSRIKIIPTTRDYWHGIRHLWKIKKL